MTVKDIFNYLNGLYPVETACDFDNVGLLIGNPDNQVRNVLITLDCTPSTVKKAIENKCELIITHHPVIFNPLKNIISGSIAYELIKADISVISMHTNLDIANGGVSETLAHAIGLKNISKFVASDGFVLRMGEISPIGAEDFAAQIKLNLGGRVKYTDAGNEIKKVLVCSGSGGDFVFDAVKFGFDALVAADIKHSLFLYANSNNLSLFDAGHFETEDVIVNKLKTILSEKFDDIDFYTDHTTKIKYK